MVYQAMLEDLCRRVHGAQGALLLDEGGEVVVESGPRDERLRLIGAYQGIALATARRSAERYGIGSVRHLVCRYSGGSIILRPLNEGYFLILSVASDVSVPRALHQSLAAQDQLNEEL